MGSSKYRPPQQASQLLQEHGGQPPEEDSDDDQLALGEPRRTLSLGLRSPKLPTRTGLVEKQCITLWYSTLWYYFTPPPRLRDILPHSK